MGKKQCESIIQSLQLLKKQPIIPRFASYVCSCWNPGLSSGFAQQLIKQLVYVAEKAENNLSLE